MSPQIIRCLGLALLCATYAPWVSGQTDPSRRGKKPDPAVAAQDLEKYRAGTAAARAAVRSGNLALVEKTLVGLARGKPNTARWHVDVAQRLLQIGEQCARDGETAMVRPLALAALANLALAEKLAATAEQRAEAITFAGFIKERYLADLAGALSAYESAAALSPKATRARESSDRLRREDDNRKGHNGGS